MGFFDFITDNLPNATKIAYFRNGQLYKMTPKSKNVWDDPRDAQFVVSDGIRYNMNSVQDIKNMAIPTFYPTNCMDGIGVRGALDYVLRMMAGQQFEIKNKDICSALLWKSTEMMIANKSGGWDADDFKRLIYWHVELGMFDESKKAREYLRIANIPQNDNEFDSYAISFRNTAFANAKRFKGDLVCFPSSGNLVCCSECAKAIGRVYSISGKSKVFPALPAYVHEHGNFHTGCRCTMEYYSDGIVYDGKIMYRGRFVDAIKNSQRDWKDTRTAEEKRYYNEYLEEQAKEEQKEKDRDEYYLIMENLPNDTPKSFSSYRRMKNAKSKNFLKLYEMAKEKGIEISFGE